MLHLFSLTISTAALPARSCARMSPCLERAFRICSTFCGYMAIEIYSPSSLDATVLALQNKILTQQISNIAESLFRNSRNYLLFCRPDRSHVTLLPSL
jgi:hypothetical protein